MGINKSQNSDSNFNPIGTVNTIFDISHLNKNVNLELAKSSGMFAVYQKATQSAGNTLFQDISYPIRKKEAKRVGLLWGAYHFGTSGNGIEQANAFLAYAKPVNDTILILDFEPNTTKGETMMSIEEARDFVKQIKLVTGKYPMIYGGSLLKQMMRISIDPILTQCDLWLAEYGSVPQLPNGWNEYTFWQYTDGTVGPGAIPVNGIGKCCRDLFKGTIEELFSYWNENQV